MQVGAGPVRVRVKYGAAAPPPLGCSKQGTNLEYVRPELRENQPRETLQGCVAALDSLLRGAMCFRPWTLAPWLIIAKVARVLETSCDGHHDELPELIDAHDRYLYGDTHAQIIPSAVIL